jgi:hypothetical protein
LYANTTANVYTVGETIGLFAVDTQETTVRGTTGTGWVLRTTGSGGRANRVQEELLVAISSFVTGDGDGFGIGGNHFIQTMRRNINLTHIIENNEVYCFGTVW